MEAKQNGILKNFDYKIPSYANSILYMFGGISASAFTLLAATGILLTQVYSPTPEGAHQSIINAIANIPLADFVRSLHFWAANLVLGLLLLHIARVFITGSYKKPRTLTWLTGVALLGVVFVYFFIGTVLKWDQEGVEAFGHLKESFEMFGIRIGLTNGGIPVITQLYSWHTTILGIVLVSLLAIHMLLIKLKGISPKVEKGAVAVSTVGQGSSSFLVHLGRLAGFGILFVVLAGLLAIIFPAPLGRPGILGQEVTKPPWVFWPFYGLENIFGLKGLIWGMAGFFVFLVIVPFIDRSPEIYFSKRKFILSLGFLFTVTLVGLAVYSQLKPPEPHIEEVSDTASVDIASAEKLDISHQRLRREAYFLVPILAGVGLLGAWLAFKKAS